MPKQSLDTPKAAQPADVDIETREAALSQPPAPATAAPAPAQPPTPTPPATYFAPPAPQAQTSRGFWRGSPAEIVFGTLMAFALIAAVILAAVRIPTATSATGASNTSGSASSSSGSTTGSNSQPSISVPAHKTYDAAAPAAPQGSTVNVKLVAQDSLISIAPNAAYHAWTFNGTVPGPVVRVRQGQTVNFTLVNNTGMAHSIDFHAAETPWSVNYQPVAAGKTFTFTWKANYPGVFMYHCGTPPVIEHIANGMYGAIIVDPATGWTPAKEYVLVQSEFYTRKMSDGSLSFDYNKAMAMQPDYVTFNGYANQYKDAPLTAQLGERVRIFVVNAGPSEFSAFHVIGAIFADTYADGNPANKMVGNQTITIPPGGGAIVELTIPAAGTYPFMTHSFANGSSGAMGMLEIKP
ncbi:MAG: multicopper oxidase domain-containing protein [Nitrososphaerota archaeon]